MPDMPSRMERSTELSPIEEVLNALKKAGNDTLLEVANTLAGKPSHLSPALKGAIDNLSSDNRRRLRFSLRDILEQRKGGTEKDTKADTGTRYRIDTNEAA